MNTRERKRSALRLIASCALLVATSLACTVIREGSGDSGPGGGVTRPGAGDGGYGEPRVVDLLVMADLDPTAAHLASHYAYIVGSIESAMREVDVSVRKMALAPLHHRVGSSVPLLLASPDDVYELVPHYATGDGAAFLSDGGEDDYANLLALGAELARAPLYFESEEGEAHFLPAADGFVVVVLGALSARCGPSSCEARAAEVASALTAGGDAGAPWLDLPGAEGLPPSRIVHLLVTAPEVDGNYGAMVESCLAYPNFPPAVLDFMEPSVEFHSRVASGISERGGRAKWIDFCAALSSETEELFAEVESLVAAAVHAR